MKCYYEVLKVSRDVSEDELRKSYRKLALKWHPDKNPDNLEEAKREFILVQQAYEVLVDPQERAWYDKHRESILKGAGSGYEDESLDIYPFFSVSCFRGFEDDEKGFYFIYSEVFNKLSAEESEYLSEDDSPPPEFGNSTTSYELVNKFYGYWSSFCTKKSYSWLNSYDISEAENRRILRLMEQENKKVRDRAKKERNEEIRALVAFVRKRDKRVLAYAEYLKQKTEANSKKTEENRRKMIAKHREDIQRYKESDWSKFSNLEDKLVEIESSMAAEYNDGSDDSDLDDLLCVACNKYFKTEKSFANHEKSKKHIDNVALLKTAMIEEDNMVQNHDVVGSDLSDVPETDRISDVENLSEIENNDSTNECAAAVDSDQNSNKKKNSKSKKKKRNKAQNPVLQEEELSENNLGISKKQLKKLEREKILAKANCDSSESESKPEENEEPTGCNAKLKKKGKKKNVPNGNDEELVVAGKSQKKKQGHQVNLRDDGDDEVLPAKSVKKVDKKQKKKGNSEKLHQAQMTEETKIAAMMENLDLSHECAVCKQHFDSKNKLFDHLKAQGHQMFLPTKAKSTKTKRKN